MKKILLGIIVLLAFSFNVFSQRDDETKLNIKPLEESLEKAMPNGKVDCNCNNNIIKDGGFENVTVLGTNITAASSPWKPNSYTPQWSDVQSPCNKGVISMWGNQAVFESIIQTGSLVPSNNYKIKFTARAVNVNALEPVVRLKISSGSNSQVSPDVSTSWTTYTIASFTAGSSDIILQPENNSALNDGAHVSWIQIDNICIEKACEIPDEKCSPKFTASAFSLNALCNVVVDVNPDVTAGATHYWGLMPATGLGDNTAIPLSAILSGGTFGLGISSSGVATPIGMGTGINSSSSGFGYHYEGVGFGSCFKITHYIKCCSKWYSQTNTYCTKLCTEIKTSGIIKMAEDSTPDEEIKNPGTKTLRSN
jgi:hypothetical protein